MSISITGSLRIPKVTSGLAPNSQSTRYLNQPDIISPQPTLIGGGVSDIYGRESPYDSVTTQTYGQNPLQRMLPEALVSRPEYSTFLNVPNGLDAGEDYDQRDRGANFGSYDTLTGRVNTGRNNAFGQYAGVYEFNPNMECHPSIDPTVCAQAKSAMITQRTNNNMDYVNMG